MPIYEYQCTSCHHNFDMMQKYTDEPIKQCPKCFESTVIKLVSAAGFQLKGTGWYATDFKNKGTDTKASEKATKTETPSTDASSSKSESASTEKTTKSKKGDTE